VFFAPAMDLDMWKHVSTTHNINKLISYGNTLIPPGNGELASGLHGEGRMAEPDDICNFIEREINKTLPLSGYQILVTAGPTYEAIDPVRFIGNHSSGKMGFAIAEELAEAGASIILISGPSSEQTHHKNIRRIDVTSAAEMMEKCTFHFPKSKACVMSAAVADYTPVEVSTQKIKKKESPLIIELKKTGDILKTLGSMKTAQQLLVGFALETNNEEQHAVEKLHNKNLDFIVLNSLNDKGAGFQTDTNKITIIDRSLNKTYFDLKSKQAVAHDICLKLIDSIRS
jgi:phosphopantothenoylcysteine decarboxylase/phosphopantothenate--cysteine ligase